MMNSQGGVGRGRTVLVMGGSFAGPIAQWLVFFLVARTSGSQAAGEFALLLAIATPLVTATNLGLRNGYITLRGENRFSDFVVLRFVGVLVASLALLVFGGLSTMNLGVLLAVVLMKASDSMLDIWYGRWQRQQRLGPFGSMMVMNGIATAGSSFAFAVCGMSAAWVAFGSALGSAVTLVGALLVDRQEIIKWARRKGPPLSGCGTRLIRIAVDCWSIGAGQVLAGLVVNIPTWAVGMFGTSSDVGLFAASAYMITVGSLFGSSLNSVMLGKYHAEMVSGGGLSVKRSATRGTALVTLSGLAVVAVVGLVGVEVFDFIYGGQFIFTPPQLVLVALAAALNPGTFVMNAALLAGNLYTAQLSIVGMAMLASVVVVVIAMLFHTPGFYVGGLCALAGSLVKYLLSAIRLGQLADV